MKNKNIQQPTASTKQNYVPEYISIKIQDLLVLYVNLFRAKENPNIGFNDADNQFSHVLRLISDREITLKQKEIEGLLWACVLLEEQEGGSKFWHPNKLNVNTFISRLIHHKQYRYYFDKIYNFFRERKPKQGVGPENIISNEGLDDV